MKTILITGGTGLVGNKLTTLLLNNNYNVIICSRKKNLVSKIQGLSYAYWDVTKQEMDTDAIKSADVIIHLAGAGVMDKPWTNEYKLEIENSRVKSSELIVNTLKNNAHQVKSIVSSSAIGWYGSDLIANHFFIENEPASADYLGAVCKKWEASIAEATALGIRVCKLRTGIVLSKNGGAYNEFRKTLSFNIASILGNGKQMVSWIHIDDLCNQFLFALQNNIEGSYNAVAPNPIRNKELVLTIAKKICGSFFIKLPVPTFILQILLGQRSLEILKSTTVSCKKIMDAGFVFKFPTIEAAVNDLES